MKNQPWNILRFRGTGSWDSITHKAATAVIDNGVTPYWPHSVRFTTAAAHALVAGGAITLGGVTTNYAGTYKILEVPTTTTLIVESVYIAETLETTATFKFTLAPKQAFEFGGFKLTLNAAATTASENMTITVDAGAGSVYDYLLYSQDMNTLRYLNWNIQDNPEPFEKNDELACAWANATPKTYGLEVYWRTR